jgi:hypothetical protein
MNELSPIPDRRALWIAMSELFLDTDVRLHYAWVAQVAAASAFSLDELEAIFRDEVAPVLEPNLMSIAGEWAGFNEEWLVNAITAGEGKRHTMQTAALRDWQAVAHLVSCLRALPPALRQPRVALWRKLQPLFLDLVPPPPSDLPRADHLEYVFEREMMPSYGAALAGWHHHNPRLYPDAAALKESWDDWLSQAPDE